MLQNYFTTAIIILVVVRKWCLHQTDRSIVVCIANKGVTSLGVSNTVQDDRKVNKFSNKPESSNPKSTVSDIELSDLSVKQI